MSPLTAKVKCPHGGKEVTDNPEAAREVAREGVLVKGEEITMIASVIPGRSPSKNTIPS